MSKEIKELVPDLRFPEFKNAPEWKQIHLGSISEVVRGGSPRPIQDYLTTDASGLNWLKIADVPSEEKYIDGTRERVISSALASTREVYPGDLILSNSMSFGRPYISRIRTCIHDGWIAIRKISNSTFEEYLYYFISGEMSQHYFEINAAGAAVRNLNADIVKLLPVLLPSHKEEQQKIASCLSSLDNLITAHTQKLEALKAHKKALLQNLFPQEGERVPRLRFKGFEGEWERAKIGDYFELLSGQHLNPDEYTTTSNETAPYFSGPSDFTNDPAEVSKWTLINAKFAKRGCILITVKGSGVGSMMLLELPKVAIGRQLMAISTTNASIAFLYYQLSYYGKYFQSLSTGNMIPGLSRSDILTTPIFLPSLPEQERIAICLSSVANRIEALRKKNELLKLHKKALLQNLFPSASETV